MFKRTDPYSFSRFLPLLDGSGTDPMGTLTCEYQVNRYDDVQLNGVAAAQMKGTAKFLVFCTQKVNIFNPAGMNLSPDTNLSSYNNYPVLLNCAITPQTDANAEFELLEYSPQTVNSKIQSSSVNGSSNGQTTGTSSNSTVGSSTATTNSYGATASFDSASVNYEHATTTTQESSHSTGTESSSTKASEASNAASMSVKDWGAYALVNAATRTPTWSFGQEYPWDCIECRKTDGVTNPNNSNQVHLILPSAMTTRLYDTVSLYPPSQLSMFGFSFVMKAAWLITADEGWTGDLAFSHALNYFTGSHALSSIDASGVAVFLDQQPVMLTTSDPNGLSTSLSLPLMALDPLGVRGAGAIVGFIPNKFFVPPLPSTATSAATPFTIVSTANNLLITDTTTYPTPDATDANSGFSAAETALTGTFTQNCLSLQITLYFKVTNTIDDYFLYIKHWKSGSVGVMLTLVVNGDAQNPIKKYVDETEAEGGEKNLLAIALRNQDYSSVDYHDYLQLGLNSVQITITPLDATNFANSGYQIRAISIE